MQGMKIWAASDEQTGWFGVRIQFCALDGDAQAHVPIVDAVQVVRCLEAAPGRTAHLEVPLMASEGTGHALVVLEPAEVLEFCQALRLSMRDAAYKNAVACGVVPQRAVLQ
jgi:hypothetical protein